MTDDKIVQAANWLNEKLLPILGPPPLGPYDDDSAEWLRHERGDDICPICGHRLAEHDVIAEPADGKVWLHCPGRPAGEQLETGRKP